MTRKKNPCINHQSKSTSIRCFNCQAYICAACQKRHFHHIFCSIGCIVRFLTRQTVTVRHLAYTALALIVFQTSVYLMLSPEEDTGAAKKPPDPDNFVTEKTDTLRIGTIPAVIGNMISLTIPTERAGVIAVIKNHQFVHSQMVEAGAKTETGFLLEHGSNRFEIWFLDDKGISACLDSFAIDFRHPDYETLSRPLNLINTESKIVALTFDAGSGRNGADSLIKVITDRGLRLTFFLTGAFIRNHPDIVRLLVEEGQEIGNHTDTHPSLTTWSENGRHDLHGYVDQRFLRNQLSRADSLFHLLTGRHMQPFWRAPFGEYNTEILQWAALAGYKHIGWTPGGDTWDWVTDTTSKLYLTGDALYEKLRGMEESGQLKGAILLMHLNTDRLNDPLFKSLPRIIDLLRQRGYKILSVSELLKSPLNV